MPEMFCLRCDSYGFPFFSSLLLPLLSFFLSFCLYYFPIWHGRVCQSCDLLACLTALTHQVTTNVRAHARASVCLCVLRPPRVVIPGYFRRPLPCSSCTNTPFSSFLNRRWRTLPPDWFTPGNQISSRLPRDQPNSILHTLTVLQLARKHKLECALLPKLLLVMS